MSPTRICIPSSSSWIGLHESRLDIHAEDADVRDPIELTDRPEPMEETDDEEFVRFMNDGRGGARDPNANIPCSSTRDSRIEVSARVESLSWLFLGVTVGRRRVCSDREDELEARDDRDVLDGVRDRRDLIEEDELVRGADAGMTTPDLRMADLENLGALLARSGVGSFEDG